MTPGLQILFGEMELAGQNVFYFIGMFYNPKRYHSLADGLLADGLFPLMFEQQYFNRIENVY